MVKTGAVDIREFIRFFFTGVTATVGNIAAVWAARHVVPYEIALVAGLVAGLTMSFLLSKLFAFNSRSWERASGEVVRFLLVYAGGCLMYGAVAIVSARCALAYGLGADAAELGGALAGSASMTLTSYFGHRFFTYRTYQCAGQRLGSAP